MFVAVRIPGCTTWLHCSLGSESTACHSVLRCPHAGLNTGLAVRPLACYTSAVLARMYIQLCRPYGLPMADGSFAAFLLPVLSTRYMVGCAFSSPPLCHSCHLTLHLPETPSWPCSQFSSFWLGSHADLSFELTGESQCTFHRDTQFNLHLCYKSEAVDLCEFEASFDVCSESQPSRRHSVSLSQ